MVLRNASQIQVFEYLKNKKSVLDGIKAFFIIFKSALSGLRQFLATESPFKMMKNPFYFTLRALFVLKKFIFFLLFGNVEKRLD